MIYDQSAGQTQFVGNAHGQISPHLKAWIMQDNVCVVGVIAEGTSRQLQTNWDSPFEGANADNTDYSTVAALAQSELGVTTVTKMNSMQLWKGAQPHTFALVLSLYALKSAKLEVMDAIRNLEKFASTNLNERSPAELSWSAADMLKMGHAPKKVMLNIGRLAIYDDVIIESVDTPLGGPKDAGGNLVSAEVTLNLQSYTAINKRDIDATFGL